MRGVIVAADERDYRLLDDHKDRNWTLPATIVIVLVTFGLFAYQKAVPRLVRVACVGDSITYGMTLQSPATQSWPAVLGRKLGRKYDVRNFGAIGRTMLYMGDLPYCRTEEYKKALAFEPDIVILTLGTNDTKPWNWNPHRATFAHDATLMIKSFQNLPSHPLVYVGIPITVAHGGAGGIRESVLNQSVRPDLLKVIAATGAKAIDFHGAMLAHQDTLVDNVHPNAAGHAIMAEYAFHVLTQKAL